MGCRIGSGSGNGNGCGQYLLANAPLCSFYHVRPGIPWVWQCRRQLKAAGTNVVGVVLNHVED